MWQLSGEDGYLALDEEITNMCLELRSIFIAGEEAVHNDLELLPMPHHGSLLEQNNDTTVPFMRLRLQMGIGSLE